MSFLFSRRIMLIFWFWVSSASSLIAQSVFIDLTFARSAGSCNGSTACITNQLKFNNQSLADYEIGDVIRIPIQGSVPQNYDIQGRFECDDQLQHCDNFREQGTMPAINSVRLLTRGSFMLCSEYTMQPPLVSDGTPCGRTSVELNINTPGKNHRWEATIDGINYQTVANSKSATLTKAELQTILGNIDGAYIQFRCVITDCYPRLSELSSAIRFFSAAPQVILAPTNPTCYAASNGSLNVVITSSTGLVDDFDIIIYRDAVIQGNAVVSASLANSSTQLFTGLPAGNYFAVVKNNTNPLVLGSCETTSNQQLTNPPEFSITHTGTNVSCHGFNNGVINVVTTNAVGSVSYSWSGGGTGTNSRTSCPPGNYSVTATDANNCTDNIQNIVITEPPPLDIDLESTGGSGNYDVSCFGGTDGVITSDVTGGAGGNLYYGWSNGQTSTSISNVSAGVYMLVVSDQNDCQTFEYINLQSPPQLSVTIELVNEIDCPPGNGSASSSGALTVGNITNAIGGVSYLWSNQATSASITNLGPGNYTLTVTDGQGCSATDNHQLSAPAPNTLQVTAMSDYNGSRISCYGEFDGELSAQLLNSQNSPVSANYEWFRNYSPSSFGGGQQVSNLDAAPYRVVASYGDGCSVEQTYNLLQPAQLTSNITPTSNHHGFPISCPGASDGSLTATPVGGTPGAYTFEWEDGSTTQQISGIPAGNYIVSVTDINGCEGSGSYTLNDPLPIMPSINITSNYHGQSLSCTDAHDGVLTASSTNGAAPIQFFWDHGATGMIAKNLGHGTYSLTAIDANNCQVWAQAVEIINPAPVQASISVLSDYNGQAIRCFNESNGILRAVGTGGTNVYSYAWSTTATTMELNDVPHGTYSVTVTDQNNCHDSEIIEITNPQEVVGAIHMHSDYNGFGVQCNGLQNGFIEVSAAGGTGEFTFMWPSLMETTPRVETLGPGIYNIEITDTNGCSDALAYEITEPDELEIQLQNATDITCFSGSDGVIVADATGGVGELEFSLDNNTWQTLPEFTSLVAEVDYHVVTRDANGCIASFSKSLTQPGEIQIDFEVTPSLCSEPVGSVAAHVTGGVGNFALHWRNQEGQTMGVSESIQNLLAGIYSLEATDEEECKVISQIGVTNLDGPTLAVETQRTSCFASDDGSATVTVENGNGPFAISWIDNQASWSRSDLNAGIHYASVEDVNSCVSVAEVEIESPAPINISVIDKKDPACFMSCDGEVKAIAEGGNGEYQFIWNESPGSSENTGLCAGWHQLRVSDQLGCVGILNVELINPEKLALKVLRRSLPSCHNSCDGSIEVAATGGDGQYRYAWAAGSQIDVQSNICSGNHLITVADGKNCELIENVALGNVTPVNVQLVKFQSPVCFGDCNGVVEIAANGGAGNYDYLWENGVAQPENLTLCSGEHTVVVADQNDCETQITYTVPEIPELKIDLGGGIVLCEGQEHKLDVGLSWKNIEWLHESELVSTASHLTVTEAGDYSVRVRDKDDCEATDNFVLEISNDLLDALFIVADEAFVSDTVAIIDISWPLPENISWHFPDEMAILEDRGDVVFGAFEDGGEFEISLSATLGKCRDEITKTITIIDSERSIPGGRLGAGEDFVKTLTLHPNPNTGTFAVEVEFIEETPVAMFIWNTVNSKLMAEVRDEGKSTYKKHFSLAPISSGLYLLKVEYKTGIRVLRFLVH